MRTIEQDILSWSKDFLEQPNPLLGNKPVCPFAENARKNDKLNIVVVDDGEDLIRNIIAQCNKFHDNGKDICIIACPDLEVTSDELDNYIHALNHVFVPKDVYLMASHPNCDIESVDFLENTDWESDNEFLMVLIQSFRKLELFSNILKKQGFYKHWSKDYYEATVLKRQTYERLKKCEE
tara:strand:+ start:46 stop:585 length:540 start_codon:yes stop_codon:yes gene_type:complete